MDLVGGDIGQVRFRNGAYQLERIGAASRQSFGGQRQQRPQCERIAQFRVDKFDCAHGWQPRPFVAKQDDKAVTAWRQLQARSVAVALFVGNWKRVMPALFQAIPQKPPAVSKIR
jgi:hypothetical protein